MVETRKCHLGKEGRALEARRGSCDKLSMPTALVWCSPPVEAPAVTQWVTNLAALGLAITNEPMMFTSRNNYNAEEEGIRTAC